MSEIRGAEDELELSFSINAPLLGSKGETADLECVLGAANKGNLLDDFCLWVTPTSRVLKGYKTGVVTENGTAVAGYSANGDDSKCGLRIDALAAGDFGQWQCRLNEESSAVPFHRGSFNLLESDHVRDVRLPSHIQQHVYEVKMVPVFEEDALDDFIIYGSVVLHFTFDENNLNGDESLRKKIYLHSKEIQIDESSVAVKMQSVEDGYFNVSGHEYDREREFYIVHLEDELDATPFMNDYDLSMNFVSSLNDKLVGFYRSSYTENGVKKYMAVSQFESTDARRAFPCLDEPDKKAMFIASLGRPKHMIGRSNMPHETMDVPITGTRFVCNCSGPRLLCPRIISSRLMSLGLRWPQ